MKVFLTGATGFIGAHLLRELQAAGHRVTGLTRTSQGARTLLGAGAAVVEGDVADPACLHAAANAADAVIHAALNHDFGRIQQSSAEDRRAIEVLGKALAGSDRPLIVTSGTGLVRPHAGRAVIETDAPFSSAEFPRAASEEAAHALMARGGRVMVMRLPQVHDTRRQGRISWHVQIARQQGKVAYLGEGTNHVAAVHVSDAVRLYRLALEQGQAGSRYHAVAEQGVALRDIAECIATRLGLRAESITPAEAPGYFGAIAPLAALDLVASGTATQRQLGWHPAGPDLLSDLRNLELDPS